MAERDAGAARGGRVGAMRGARALVCGCMCALVCGMPLQTADFEHGDSSSPLQDGPESLGAVWNGELHRLLVASEDDQPSEEAGSGADSPDDDGDPPARRWRRNSALFLGFLSTLVALACIYIVFSSGGLVILDESEGLYECHLTLTLALTHTLAGTPALALPPTLALPLTLTPALTRSPHANPNPGQKACAQAQAGLRDQRAEPDGVHAEAKERSQKEAKGGSQRGREGGRPPRA